MEFREIPNFKYYFADTLGNIYSKKGIGKVEDSYNNPLRKLKFGINNSGKGYYFVSLCSDKPYNRMVHRIIVETFRGNIPDGMVVSHLNGDRYDNRLENLIVESQKDNLKRKVEHGNGDSGYNNTRALINKEQLEEIRKLLKEGHTHASIAKKFNVSRVFITKINTGYRYKN